MKEMVFYGNAYTDIVIASVLELLMRGKRVVVCDLTPTRTVVTELENISGSFDIAGRHNLVVARGYTEEECDYRFVCMGMGQVWSRGNCEHFAIINYSWAAITAITNLFYSLQIVPTLIIIGPVSDEITDIVRDIRIPCKDIVALPYSTKDMDVMMQQRMIAGSCLRIYSDEMRSVIETIIG